MAENIKLQSDTRGVVYAI
jgi:hypothetical protein